MIPAPVSSPASAVAAAERPRLAKDFDTFLTLLTTQLRNQSPTDPLNVNEMTAQLVQFATVEQQILANRQLERLVALQRAAQVTAAAPLLGAVVEAESDLLPLAGGEARLRLAASEAPLRIRITDGTGRVLREEEVPPGGPRLWQWDGREADGRPVPDGAYRVAVLARGADGTPRPAGFTVLGRVSGIEPNEKGVSVLLNGVAVPLERVRLLQAAGK
jgi:flagellar basal-body rod modification protein FlgD